MAYGALSFVLIMTVIVAAYSTSAPGLSIAEFAPSAQNAIDQTPPTEAGSKASGRGGRRSTTTSPLGVTTVPPSDLPTDSDGTPTSLVGRGRNCYGNPPRQSPDPSSPPCIATIFEGDNGGATTNGVTASEIRIAFPQGNFFFKHHAKLAVEWFNQHFEFYGRRLVAVEFPWPSSDPAQARALAEDIGRSNIFGSIDAFRGVGPSFHAGMARNKIVTVAIGYESLLDDKTTYDAMHPYIWSVYPSMEQIGANFSSFACTALVGKPAIHAPDYKDTTRKFGIFVRGNKRLPSVSALEAGLKACGAEVMVAKVDGSVSGSSESTRNAWQNFKAGGVTSVVCACVDSSWSWMMDDAKGNGFKPEWMLPGFSFGAGDEEIITSFKQPADQTRIFGMTPTPKILPYQAQPFFPLHFALTPSGNSTSEDLDPRVMESVYRQMLVMASGIQMAGPNLTADTFAQGLMSAEFPNEGTGQAPYYQPKVDFGPGDHNFISDYAIAWFNPNIEGYTWIGAGAQVKGSWCYLGAGTRYSVGNFPADVESRLFSPSEPCR